MLRDTGRREGMIAVEAKRVEGKGTGKVSEIFGRCARRAQPASSEEATMRLSQELKKRTARMRLAVRGLAGSDAHSSRPGPPRHPIGRRFECPGSAIGHPKSLDRRKIRRKDRPNA